MASPPRQSLSVGAFRNPEHLSFAPQNSEGSNGGLLTTRPSTFLDEAPAVLQARRRYARPGWTESFDHILQRSMDSLSTSDVVSPKEQLIRMHNESSSFRRDEQRCAPSKRTHLNEPSTEEQVDGTAARYVLARAPSVGEASSSGAAMEGLMQPPPPPSLNPYMARNGGQDAREGLIPTAPQQAMDPQRVTSYSRFLSEYQCSEELGHGNFSKVYRAAHRLTGADFAVKTNRSPIASPQARQTWINEMQALAAVQPHPNIIGLYDAWFEPEGGGGAGSGGGAERAFLKLELCGRSLGEAVRRRTPLRESEVLSVIRQMASALKRIHDLGMVHLDVKPDNIYLGVPSPGALASADSCSQTGVVYKLGDFGLATVHGGQRAGTSEGDCRYLAPEALKSRDFLSSRYADRLDVFALGASAYELLRGSELPKNGQLYHDIRAGKIFLPGSANQRVVGLLRKMMAPDPQQRPSADQLTKMFASRPPRDRATITTTTTSTTSRPATMSTSPSRRPGTTTAATATAAAVAAMRGYYSSSPTQRRPRRREHAQSQQVQSQQVQSQQQQAASGDPGVTAIRPPSVLLYQVMRRGLSHPLLPRPPPACAPLPLGPRLASARHSRRQSGQQMSETAQQQQQ